MPRKIKLKCQYREHATGHVGSNWGTICDHHEDELPGIRGFTPGSFNLTLREPRTYVPPRDREFKEKARRKGQSGGNPISPLARVIELNGKPVEARLYRGGHPDDSLELLSPIRLRDFLGVTDGTEVAVIIEEDESNA
jgi:CTP-dependent riboflavin kinase